MKKAVGGRWLVVYMCQGSQNLERAEKLLNDEGFLVRSRALNRGASDGAFEIYALESEAQEARDFLLEKGL